MVNWYFTRAGAELGVSDDILLYTSVNIHLYIVTLKYVKSLKTGLSKRRRRGESLINQVVTPKMK